MSNSRVLTIESSLSTRVLTSLRINTLVFKAVASGGIAFWIFALFQAWNTPAAGYEASIYISTPLVFWIANIFNFAIGTVFIFVHLSSRSSTYNSLNFVVGISLVLLSFASVLAVYILRGYALFSPFDSLTHLGWINRLIETGHFESLNFYPVTHIYIAGLSMLFDISASVFHKIVPFIFALFGVIFFYCFARQVLPLRGHAIMATLIWMTFLSNWYLDLTPNMLANFMFPLGLFILMRCLKSGDFQWKVLFAVFIILLPLFHTLVGFIFAAVMIAIAIASKLVLKNRIPITKGNFYFLLISLFSLLLWNSLWMSSFSQFRNLARNLMLTISGLGTSNLDLLVTQTQYATSYNYSVLGGFLKIYGGASLVLLLAIAGFFCLLRRKNKDGSDYWVMLCAAPIAAIAVCFVALYLQVTGFPPERLIIYVLLFGTLFCGYLFYNMLRKFRDIRSTIVRKLPLSVLIIAVLALFVAGGLKLYPSPYVYQPAMQVTDTQLAGMRWLIISKDVTKQLTSISVYTNRFGWLFLTQEQVRARPDIKWYTDDNALDVPYHFGYDRNQYLAQSYSEDVYVVLSGKCRAMYESVYPDMAPLRFDSADYAEFNSDPTVNKLYGNTGLDIYYVKLSGSSP